MLTNEADAKLMGLKAQWERLYDKATHPLISDREEEALLAEMLSISTQIEQLQQ